MMTIKSSTLFSALSLGLILSSVHAAEMQSTSNELNLAQAVQEPEEDGLETSLSTGWSSKYVSEGLDCFEKGGVWEFNSEFAYKGFSFSTWYGLSDSINARELKLTLGYEHEITDKLTAGVSWEHCFTYPGYEDTPAIDLNYAVTDEFKVGVMGQWMYHNKHARGYYGVYCEYAYDITEKLHATATILYAFNEGYVPGEDLGEEEDHYVTVYGSSNIDYSLGLEYELTDQWTLTASLNYTQALTVLHKADLGDLFWASMGVTFSF